MNDQPENPGLDLRSGRWEKTLADVEHVDALITDAPYGARTHTGHRVTGEARDTAKRRRINYACWDRSDVLAFVASWHPRTRGWICAMTSHDLIPHWEDAFAWAGRYCFAPLPVITRAKPRLRGDGPGSGAVWLVVARPRSREMASWGSLPPWYIRQNGDTESPRAGGKPLGLMRRIVADYSRPGDLVCDPCAGAGTTLAAALLEGRRAIGCEVDEHAAAAAIERLSMAGTISGTQASLFTEGGKR